VPSIKTSQQVFTKSYRPAAPLLSIKQEDNQMRFSFCENNQELGALSASPLWADVYRLSRHSSEKSLDIEKWLELYHQAISYARYKGASHLKHRLVEERDHALISDNLPHLNFVKKDDRIEFRHSLTDLPGDDGTPFDWKDAKSSGWTEEKIALFLHHIAQGDPTYDPAESAIDFVRGWLSDSVLTCGLELIWIGHMKGTPAALVVVQINPTSGWSRISYMGVAPEYRGKGLGQWVHRKGFSALKQQGGVLYHGGTSAKNAAMLKLFERHKCPVYLKMEEWQLDLR
jgi:GNAT superfamily N-acetyltransferase